MKHYWHEAMYIPSVEDTGAAWRVANRFKELRADDFTGGFVLRRFERFTGAEVRTWWLDGVCRLVGAHPDTPAATPADDGRWRVVELGDGQVSDRPTTMSATDLISALA